MEIRLTLSLPRDELSIPVVRRICSQAMEVLGVTADCISDIGIAISEACSNVLQHAEDGDDYSVVAGITDLAAVIEVVDSGSGFDSDASGRRCAPDDAESGRGVQLMRALVDNVRFAQGAHTGSIVRLEKVLEWADGAAGPQLVLAEEQAAAGHRAESQAAAVSAAQAADDVALG